MARKDSPKKPDSPPPRGIKYTISRVLFAFLVLSNIYLLYRIDSNNVAISNYNAGYSQRSGVGRLDSFWTKYIGGIKNPLSSYEDRVRTEEDSDNAVMTLFVMDAVLVAAIYWLNKTPKVKEPELTEEEKRRQRWERRNLR